MTTDRTATRGTRLARLAFLVAVVGHLAALYWPRAVSTGEFSYSDKLAHVVLFAVVAVTGLLARVPAPPLVGLLLGNAVVSELVQHWLLPHRSGDVLDSIADVIGVLLGTASGVALRRREGS